MSINGISKQDVNKAVEEAFSNDNKPREMVLYLHDKVDVEAFHKTMKEAAIKDTINCTKFINNENRGNK